MNSLEVLRSELTAALGGLDEDHLKLRPARNASSWSIQQIAGHLRLTYLATIEAIDARLAKRTPTKATPSPVQYLAQFTLIRVGYFPRGRKAPDRVTPSGNETAAAGRELIFDLETALSSMDSKISRAAEFFGERRRVISHMILGPLSTRQWQKFHLVHGRHHIRQILAIRREHGV